MKQAVLSNVVIFDRKDLSVNGLSTAKYGMHFSLVDFIVKDRTLVLLASLVLYNTGKELKFVKSNIGKTIEDYSTFQKHIRERNEELVFEVGEVKRKEVVIADIEEEMDVEDDTGVLDVDGVIVINSKDGEKNGQKNRTVKTVKGVCKGKNNTCSCRTTRRVKRK